MVVVILTKDMAANHCRSSVTIFHILTTTCGQFEVRTIMMRIAIVADYINHRVLRKERVFNDGNNPVDSLSDAEVLRNYRFTRKTIFELTEVVAPDLDHPTHRDYSLSSNMQLLY